MSLAHNIDPERIPSHVAIIMDGNGRWAKQQGKPRIFGHKNGVKSVRETTEAAAEIGVKYLTLYAFSSENWNRPKTEIEALMSLLVSSILSETKTLIKNNIRLTTIGNLAQLPLEVQGKIAEAKAKTYSCTGLTLIIAISYGSRWEIVEAAKRFAQEVSNGTVGVNDLTTDSFANLLDTAGIPDPELMIRTSGEYRISNFLLWQLAYSELHFTNTLWPDFRKNNFYQAIIDYQNRERRFGLTSEQL